MVLLKLIDKLIIIVQCKVVFRCMPLCIRRSLKLYNGFKFVFLIDRMIKEEGFCVYNMYNIVEKHLSISIAHFFCDIIQYRST
jgi:hypothetical protein